MIKITIISFIIYSFMYGQDINPREIMERSYTLKKPMTSIMDMLMLLSYLVRGMNHLRPLILFLFCDTFSS